MEGATPISARGDMRTLLACFLHFDVSFMLWVLPGALGVFIAESLDLTPAQKGLVVAAPILTGALLRIPAGLLADSFGAKRVGVFMLAFPFVPLALGRLAAGSFEAWVITSLMLGAAGTSFAVALSLASRSFPPERQGLVMGIAAAGNSGTVIANLAAPRLALIIGWPNVLLAAMAPAALALAIFTGLAREQRTQRPIPSRRRLPRIAREPDLWRLCGLYAVTFGGYMGLTAFFPLLLRTAHSLGPVEAGYMTALVAVAGSAVRPLGGYAADRLGGPRVLALLFASLAVLYAGIALASSPAALMLVSVPLFLCLGAGNGALFQIVAGRFSDDIGAATGVVGAVGGVGGFLLPNILAGAEGVTGSFQAGFIALALIALGAFVSLRAAIRGASSGPSPAPRAARVAMVPYL
ncbi:MAG TPA: MFS transporter [Dehalococcoidia bacterium]|nr:MFS transporter [Dehalococcoidia bacterium]